MDDDEARVLFFQDFAFPEEDLIRLIQGLVKVIGGHIFVSYIDKKVCQEVSKGLVSVVEDLQAGVDKAKYFENSEGVQEYSGWLAQASSLLAEVNATYMQAAQAYGSFSQETDKKDYFPKKAVIHAAIIAIEFNLDGLYKKNGFDEIEERTKVRVCCIT
jgi:hypothetical protein